MDDYNKFTENIKSKTGIDLSLYKEGQMKRRLTSLRDKRGFSNFDNYFQAVAKDHFLFEEFLQRMTINVSEFYRNPQRWKVLEEKIIPRLLARSPKIKVWSAACSTGEEPYSLMMLLHNYRKYPQINLLATDLDEAVLARAKAGFYTERALKEVGSERLEKYFSKEDLGYRVGKELKQAVSFKKHNLLSDSFDRNYDLIVCRNVMIYFTEQAKDELYKKFSRALKPGGVLFVGSTEQIFQANRYGLEAEDTFFYKKISDI
ncbi:CheR family methyltransferase [Salipaludibacillus aurantiacus]|uniref:protein-glutamate O-methyltransferase n=1 Tax=Salipaludibacillus aurantiacus TaxID=1601833 RepID=A0A1H9P812_9BACI|nr:protein-glutamate O-methyltransferase CheR [Salipaludibacillus aurantiacus]SER44342.1 chemotaxis protein methyltransferase CheR [Salipaludibacillus aurantiacus]